MSSSSITQRTNLRYDFLDVARGIAALLVVFQHAVQIPFPGFFSWGDYRADIGLVGVTLFFLVSGFVIPVSLERGGLKRFWIARFFRLWPLYLTSLALIFLLGRLGFVSAPQMAKDQPLMFLGANATMLQEYMGVRHAMPLYWTLSLELIFYVICSVLVVFKIFRMRGLTWAVLGSCFFFTFVNCFLTVDLPLGRMQLLLAAFFGYEVYTCFKGEKSVLRLMPLFFGIMANQFLTAVLAYKWEVAISWGLGFGIFIGLYAVRAVRWPRLLVWFGTLSYSVYLSHGFVTRLLPQGFGSFLWVLAVFAVTLVVAPLTYKFIEKPGIDLGRTFIGKKRNEIGAGAREVAP